MPKVVLGLYTNQNVTFARVVESRMKRTGVGVSSLIKTVGISDRTHYNRLKNPEDVRLSELRSYIKFLKIPPDDIMAVLYDEKELEKWEIKRKEKTREVT